MCGCNILVPVLLVFRRGRCLAWALWHCKMVCKYRVRCARFLYVDVWVCVCACGRLGEIAAGTRELCTDMHIHTHTQSHRDTTTTMKRCNESKRCDGGEVARQWGASNARARAPAINSASYRSLETRRGIVARAPALGRRECVRMFYGERGRALRMRAVRLCAAAEMRSLCVCVLCGKLCAINFAKVSREAHTSQLCSMGLCLSISLQYLVHTISINIPASNVVVLTFNVWPVFKQL